MYVIRTNDINDALCQGINYLLRDGIEEQSRNGPVLVAPGPVVTEYTNPRRRVLLSPTRDANCFFHLFESIWMLEGNNDIEFPCYFVKTYGQYSDDGKTMWDAYGERWRAHFGWDQLNGIVAELKSNPTSRRCVLSMWNASRWGANLDADGAPEWNHPTRDEAWYDDFGVATHGGKAVPCNTAAYFDVRNGALNMSVTNRSNDIVLGCYGANAVHFSFLQEYLAARIGVGVGTYVQFSHNFHLYSNDWPREKLEQILHESDTLGALPELGPSLELGFDDDLPVFMVWARAVMRQDGVHPVPTFDTAFMRDVALPMFQCWFWRKQKRPEHVNFFLSEIKAPDWKRACEEWVDRRDK